MVEVSLTVGRLDASLALLLTKDHHLIEFPTLLLPNDVEAGSVIRISCDRDVEQEKKEQQVFTSIQKEILDTFGARRPSTPVLKVRNVTQTSVVLEWDPIDVATAAIHSLSLFKNGQKFGVIPSPLRRKSTKLSGLSIDTEYNFHLVLSTSAGDFESNEVKLTTHKMTDLSGITICVGSLEHSDIDLSGLDEIVKRIGAKPLQDTVRLDTTHFVCSSPDGVQFQRAQDLNIPIVSPDWVRACEAERRLVGVRAYYLNADPKLRPPPTQRPRAESQGTSVSSSTRGDRSRDNVPEIKVTEATARDEAEADAPDSASRASQQAVYEQSVSTSPVASQEQPDGPTTSAATTNDVVSEKAPVEEPPRTDEELSQRAVKVVEMASDRDGKHEAIQENADEETAAEAGKILEQAGEKPSIVNESNEIASIEKTGETTDGKADAEEAPALVKDELKDTDDAQPGVDIVVTDAHGPSLTEGIDAPPNEDESVPENGEDADDIEDAAGADASAAPAAHSKIKKKKKKKNKSRATNDKESDPAQTPAELEDVKL